MKVTLFVDSQAPTTTHGGNPHLVLLAAGTFYNQALADKQNPRLEFHNQECADLVNAMKADGINAELVV